jgi:hypothetical protein
MLFSVEAMALVVLDSALLILLDIYDEQKELETNAAIGNIHKSGHWSRGCTKYDTCTVTTTSFARYTRLLSNST